jgi:hypothetical protein
MQDMDGIIGIFSGQALPPNVSTDTGLMRLTFTTDGSIQRSGWAGSFSAASTVQVSHPTCGPGSRLVQAVMRTRAAAGEASWVVSRSTVVSVVSAALAVALQQKTVVMAGGLLPGGAASSLSAAAQEASQGEYKEFRSYYSYACLATGRYDVTMYDSYGDGWGGARLTLAALNVDPSGAAVACDLVSGTVEKATQTQTFDLQVRQGRRGLRVLFEGWRPAWRQAATAGQSKMIGCRASVCAACRAASSRASVLASDGWEVPHNLLESPARPSQAASPGEACAAVAAGADYYVQAQLAITDPDPSTSSYSLTKQKRLKDSLALLLEVDTSQVCICVCVCVCTRAHVCVRARACACILHARVNVLCAHLFM